ncbi:MCRI2 protein, partial [Larus smithsonianus]|nr:MCRI2 protein [Larus smithsonianus]
RMYTLTRGPSKLATQRRTAPLLAPNRGGKSYPPPLHLPLASPHSPAQKLVFNRVNGKRPQVLPQQVSAPEECYTLAHEENVRFVYEAWQQVEQQLDSSRSGESVCGPVQYVEKTPNPGLKNFVPIDLEEWWAQQFLAKIENCS